MPLYEYQCEACGHRFEVIQKFSDPPVETCQRCGGAVKKLLSSPAIQFKGSGWYITDYAKKDSSASSSSSSTETKSEAKTESKTETKTDTSSSKPATS
jgi:putative FmdB family regulatory protein